MIRDLVLQHISEFEQTSAIIFGDLSSMTLLLTSINVYDYCLTTAEKLSEKTRKHSIPSHKSQILRS